MLANKLYVALSLLAIALFEIADVVFAFTPSHRTSSRKAKFFMTSSFFADATEPKNPEVKQQVDANGKVFAPGMVVAIAPNRSIKAYQVPKSAYGSFDPSNGQFIPMDETTASRVTSCLVLPAGLRGEIEKIYNTNEWDRAHPILVKFKVGEDRNEGDAFHVPMAFSMHLDSNEIEVLDS
ncbi:hypothetical protein ACHAWF_009664 [Thalassiosira exigua]